MKKEKKKSKGGKVLLLVILLAAAAAIALIVLDRLGIGFGGGGGSGGGEEAVPAAAIQTEASSDVTDMSEPGAVYITISGDTVTAGGTAKTIEELEAYIVELDPLSAKIIVTDDMAIESTYSEVKALLEKYEFDFEEKTAPVSVTVPE